MSTDDGYLAAELCALNVLAQIDRFVGFQNVLGLTTLDAVLVAAADWDEFPQVLDGASLLFLDVLGDAGRHARAFAGVERLSYGAHRRDVLVHDPRTCRAPRALNHRSTPRPRRRRPLLSSGKLLRSMPSRPIP